MLLCYLVPLSLLGLFYLPIGAGGYIFCRNWLRAGCGPAVQVMWWAGCGPNDLATYSVAFAFIWPTWLLAILMTPLLNRRSLPTHAALGFLWCVGGCCLTLAI